MVMHARKPPRINDGYLEKHQAHPYQVQPITMKETLKNSKYGSSKSSYGERYNHERMRDSPNGNSYRSDSPDSGSPRERDRSYQNKSSYIQKIRDKERENRDYKPRDKYSDCARSPKDKRRRESRDSEHRTNHDRNSTEKVILHSSKINSHNPSSRDSLRKPSLIINIVQDKELRDRVVRVGDWSEHLSSSGKKYYYNCKTEVSQWEKPREWVERERERERDRERNCATSSRIRDRERDREHDKDRDRQRERDTRDRERERDRDRERETRERERDVDVRLYSSSARVAHDKHSNSRATLSNSRDQTAKSRPAVADKRDALYWNSQSQSGRDEMDCHDRRKQVDGKRGEGQSQDMDICSGDSTPTSETSYSHSHTPTPHSHCGLLQPVTDGGGSTSTNNGSVSGPGPVLLANALPRLASHPSQSQPSPPTRLPYQGVAGAAGAGGAGSVGVSTMPGVPGVPGAPVMVPAPPASSTTPCNPPVTLANLPHILSQITQSQETLSPQKALQTIQTILSAQSSTSGQVPGNSSEASQVPLTPLVVDTSHSGTLGDGPPTPTHSESQDCVDARKLSSPPSSLSSLQTLSQSSSLQALRPQGPNLTPSLANHYRDDLVNHVRGWPAELLEKQAQKFSEEAHTLGSLQCTRVSAELKSARSIVRLTEIQATLQEQRVLFIRQQIKNLEELKSQHSFMADDC